MNFPEQELDGTWSLRKIEEYNALLENPDKPCKEK